jgi:hypothetical protein
VVLRKPTSELLQEKAGQMHTAIMYNDPGPRAHTHYTLENADASSFLLQDKTSREKWGVMGGCVILVSTCVVLLLLLVGMHSLGGF